MIQPIVMTQVAQCLIEDYGLTPADGFTCARTLLERLEKRDLQIIKGEWVIPEVVTIVKPQPTAQPTDRWMDLAQRVTQETIAREPWKAVELQ